MKKRILAALLILVMVVGMMPLTAAAAQEQYVYLSVFKDGQFVTTSSEKTMAYVSVAMSELKKIDLKSYNMEQYEYDADKDGNADITMLHLFIYAHEKFYGGSWGDVQVSGTSGSMFFGGGLFGFDLNMVYNHNGKEAVDEAMTEQNGGAFDVIATADHIVLKAGDFVDLSGYTDYGFWSDPEAGFRYFMDGETVTHSYKVSAEKTLNVKLVTSKNIWGADGSSTKLFDPEQNNTICYSKILLDENAKTVTTNETGYASIQFDELGTWYIWSLGDNVSSAAYAQVDVVWENPGTVSSDWKNFRNSDVNMAITSAQTPTTKENTYLKWVKYFGGGWTDAPSVQIIADNALVVMSNNKLYKLDLSNGEVMATGTMSATPSYGYTPPIFAEGLIICPLGGGIMEAFDAKTLKSVWVYKDSLGGQALSPITYSDGKLYTGFWNSEMKDANFVCVNIENGTKVWDKTVTGGFYWAGSVVVGDAVIVGTDDGEGGSSGNSHLYALNKDNGNQITEIELTGLGDQRSSIAYSAEKGRVYFTTKGGYLCSVAVNGETGALSDLKSVKQASQSTSTPLVYGDKVYFCAGSGVTSGSGGAGNFVVADADTLEQLYVVALKAYPQGSALMSTAYYETEGKLYFYTTYNGKPGGISMIKVDPTKNTSDGAELIEIYEAEGYEQFCITSLICGPDGTIYYKNDSCNVFALSKNEAWLTDLQANIGTLDKPFAASRNNYEMVVPAGTKNVTFMATACNGGTATVSGGETISLKNGVGTAEITVSVNGCTRKYTVSIREERNDNSLSFLKVNESNAFSGISLEMTPTWAPDTYFYGVYTAGESRNFINVWAEATDNSATVKIFALENIQNMTSGQEIEVTATNVGHNRYAIYFADGSKPMSIRIEVTAENGDKANYYLVMSKAAAAEQGAVMLNGLKNPATEAAQPVIEKINAINNVDLYAKDRIAEARQAYLELSPEARSFVTNYEVLAEAEKAYAELVQGVGIESIEKTSSEGNVDTYIVTLTNGVTYTFTVTNGISGTDGTNGITPQLRINGETNEWEVSYDNGTTWISLGVKATGDKGDTGDTGAAGKDGITPQIRINAETNEWEVSYDNGTTWISLGVKATGADGDKGDKGDKGDNGDKGDTGAAGTNGKDGADGKDGANGKDGVDGENANENMTVVATAIAGVSLVSNIALVVYLLLKKKKSF